MLNVKWSDITLQRIYEIADYIAKEAPQAAIKWTEELFEQEKIIRELPFAGRMVPEVRNENVRELLVGNYRLIYKVFKKDIYILTVKSQRQVLNPPNDIAK